MKIKPDWTEYIHKIRKREIDIIFSGCKENCFKSALELGAGDGYQSGLIKKYTGKLFSTELNADRLLKRYDEKIEYMICDAESIDDFFCPGSFDLVFSSNLLEHLKDKESTLARIRNVMSDNGVCISIMPGPFIKLTWILLFYPNILVEFLEVASKRGGMKKILNRMKEALACSGKSGAENMLTGEMNNNLRREPKNFIERYIFPSPHGEYRSHFEEFFAYRRTSWISLIEGQGFDVVRVLKMPVCSGYGFGLDRVRRIFEKAGFASTYAYVAFKKGYDSPFRRYWEV